MRRKPTSTDPVAISELELRSMTADLADADHETLPRLNEVLASWRHQSEGSSDRGVSRRAFLASGGLLAAGGLAFAASGAAASTVVPRTSLGSRFTHSSAPSTDVVVAALAASLENLAVATYAAALSAAGAGKLGKVPAAIGTFVTTAKSQHADHAEAWNAIVYSAGYENVTKPNAILQPSIDAAFAKVTDVAGVAKLALSLEEIAAATYLEAIEVVSSAQAIATAATIQPVEMQHAAILNFVLGSYPVPASFSTLTVAAPAKDAPKLVKR